MLRRSMGTFIPEDGLPEPIRKLIRLPEKTVLQRDLGRPVRGETVTPNGDLTDWIT